MAFDDYYPAVRAIIDDVWAHPELGFKEFHTSQLVREFIASRLPEADLTPFSTTGLDLRLSRDKPRTVGIIAELDAVISPSHPAADPQTHAVHACGHHTQVGIALALIAHYAATGAHRELPFNLAFIFVPAEEFVDLDDREQMRAQGTIGWLGGKPEAMKLGVFDDIDVGICTHAIGEHFTQPTIEINCDLAGFMYKFATFHGKATHAGFNPFDGINAFSMATLFTSALGMSRQQLREGVNNFFVTFIEVLRDRVGAEFPVKADAGCRNTVFNNRAQTGAEYVARLLALGARAFRVEFLNESPEELQRTVRSYQQLLRGEITGAELWREFKLVNQLGVTRGQMEAAPPVLQRKR